MIGDHERHRLGELSRSDDVEDDRWEDWAVARRMQADLLPEAMVYLLETLRGPTVARAARG